MILHGHVSRVLPVLMYIITCFSVQAGPVIRSSRMVREIYPEVEQEIPDSSQTQACTIGSVRYAPNSQVPSTQPCLQCTCLAGSVVCSSEICIPQPGCRAVHRPGRCCASYTCECTHAGRIYANGERLPQPPGAECSVCYCRGGHVQCAEVGCYTRGDCEAKYVKGECCPKYDHCPPRDPLSDRIIGTSPSLQNLDPELLTSWSQTRPENTSSEEGSGDDDIILSDEPRRPSTPVTFSIKEIESKSNSKRNDDKKVIKIDQATQTDAEGRPQITIQEVIPPRTEFIPHKAVSISPINPVTYKNQEMLSSTDASNDLSDVESYASEKTEVYDHPPPVLRIGDQLLFIKQGQLVPEKDASTPTPVITLIGAEGLQIGLGSGELLDQEVLSTSESVSTSKESDESDESSTTEPKLKMTSEENTEVVSIINDNASNTSSSMSSSTLEPEQSEYIPEENPYYPAIPEDIMIVGQDEVTTDVIPLPAKILPDVLELRNNKTIPTNESIRQEWLKEQPIRINIPLVNEQAALPDAILELTAPSDLTSNSEDDITSTEIISSTEIYKSDKIVVPAAQKSKETIELFESDEFTTITPIHSSILSSNEDASVEVIQNDSTPIDTSDLVEMIPGYERVTEKIVEQSNDEMSPKDDVEIINVDDDDDTTHIQMKDFHDEIQKRDVVKKVLKDTYENPKENIRTDLIEETTNLSVEISEQNNEQNIVKPNHDVITRSLNTTVVTSTEKELNSQESKETLDTKVLKSQFRQYHNSKLAD